MTDESVWNPKSIEEELQAVSIREVVKDFQEWTDYFECQDIFTTSAIGIHDSDHNISVSVRITDWDLALSKLENIFGQPIELDPTDYLILKIRGKEGRIIEVCLLDQVEFDETYNDVTHEDRGSINDYFGVADGSSNTLFIPREDKE